VGVNWAEVYEATYRELVRFLYRKVWDVERAQDLTQEVFVRALRHEPESPRAWLFHVANNLARDEARKAITRREHLQLLRNEASADAVTEVADVMERSERIEAIREALDQLSERDRDALLLWEAGLSYTEIARELGLSVGAIGTTLARARQRLVRAYNALEEKHVARG
jgi:RNA polymerase sigma factor (sigma-70 family)